MPYRKLSPIEERLKERVPRVKSPDGRTRQLSMLDELMIVWGWAEGLSGSEIARRIPCHQTWVYEFKKDAIADLRRIFDLPVLLQLGPRKFQCQICSETRPTRIRAMRHVLAHIMSQEWAMTAPVDQIRFL